MKLIQEQIKWRTLLSGIGLFIGIPIFFLSLFMYEDVFTRMLICCIPFLLPLLFGHGLKMRIPALLLIFGIIIFYNSRYVPIREKSPDGNSRILFLRKGNNDCYTVVIDDQVFNTGASIYQSTRGEWRGNDVFILKSSDIGDIEFRKENGRWVVAPESEPLLHHFQ